MCRNFCLYGKFLHGGLSFRQPSLKHCLFKQFLLTLRDRVDSAVDFCLFNAIFDWFNVSPWSPARAIGSMERTIERFLAECVILNGIRREGSKECSYKYQPLITNN